MTSYKITLERVDPPGEKPFVLDLDDLELVDNWAGLGYGLGSVIVGVIATDFEASEWKARNG